MATPEVLKMLEERIEALELRLTDCDPSKEPPNKSSLTEVLLNVNTKIQAAVAAREKLSVLKKTEEIERYLDAECQEKADLTEGAKLQLILAEEDRIRKVIAAYQKMEDLKPVLDSTYIKGEHRARHTGLRIYFVYGDGVLAQHCCTANTDNWLSQNNSAVIRG